MKKVFRLLALICVMVLCSHSASAQNVSQEYLNLTQELVQLTNVRETTINALVQTYDNMPQLKFSIPTRDVVTEMVDAGMPLTIKATAEAYSKYFSLSELNQLIAFYKTPVGSKLSKALPDITNDIMNSSMNELQVIYQPIIMKYIKY